MSTLMLHFQHGKPAIFSFLLGLHKTFLENWKQILEIKIQSTLVYNSILVYGSSNGWLVWKPGFLKLLYPTFHSPFGPLFPPPSLQQNKMLCWQKKEKKRVFKLTFAFCLRGYPEIGGIPVVGAGIPWGWGNYYYWSWDSMRWGNSCCWNWDSMSLGYFLLLGWDSTNLG